MIVVVFPAPFVPRKPVTSPRPSDNVRLSTAFRDPNERLTPSSSKTLSSMAKNSITQFQDLLVKKTEEPERNTRGATNFRIVYRKIGVRLILDLLKRLIGAANFK